MIDGFNRLTEVIFMKYQWSEVELQQQRIVPVIKNYFNLKKQNLAVRTLKISDLFFFVYTFLYIRYMNIPERIIKITYNRYQRH